MMFAFGINFSIYEHRIKWRLLKAPVFFALFITAFGVMWTRIQNMSAQIFYLRLIFSKKSRTRTLIATLKKYLFRSLYTERSTAKAVFFTFRQGNRGFSSQLAKRALCCTSVDNLLSLVVKVSHCATFAIIK